MKKLICFCFFVIALFNEIYGGSVFTIGPIINYNFDNNFITISDNQPKEVIKPWGKEEWLSLNEFYCYKRIYINSGYKTSFQYHKVKYETIYIA